MNDVTRNLELYQSAKNSMLAYVANRTDVVGCLEYGRMSNPGVSDLDLIVVCKNECETGLADYLSLKSLPSDVVEIMAHANLIIVNETARDGIFYWDDIQVRDLMLRQNEYWSMLPADDGHRKVAMVVDWLFERIYRVIAYHSFGTKDARKTLGDLKSFCFCIENLAALGVDLDGFADLKQKLTELRADWVGLDESSRLLAIKVLVTCFFEFLPEVYARIFPWFEKHPLFESHAKLAADVSLTFPGGMLWRFVSEPSKEFGVSQKQPFVQVPLCLLEHFSVYCRPKKELSQKYCASFSVDPRQIVKGTESAYEMFLERRMFYCNEWYDFLVKNNFGYGLYKFGWYLPKVNQRSFVIW